MGICTYLANCLHLLGQLFAFDLTSQFHQNGQHSRYRPWARYKLQVDTSIYEPFDFYFARRASWSFWGPKKRNVSVAKTEPHE